MDKIKILWADDEIDLLKPHLLFLQAKGYEVVTATNGHDALEVYDEQAGDIDVVFLDESMPGLTGLEVLPRLKERNANVPVVMITKNEAEHVMEEAIGSQISDYLIKPVNPNQILLTLKKIIDNKRLVREKTAMDYQQEFRQIYMQVTGGLNHEEWVDAYRRIVSWELRLDANQAEVGDILAQQKEQANTEFSKYVVKNYFDWVDRKKEIGPIMSHSMMRKRIFPHIGNGVPTLVVLLDNLRYDQWKVIEPILHDQFRTEQEDYFYSILPTATQYSRNAIFAGMMPDDIAMLSSNTCWIFRAFSAARFCSSSFSAFNSYCWPWIVARESASVWRASASSFRASASWRMTSVRASSLRWPASASSILRWFNAGCCASVASVASSSGLYGRTLGL